MLQDRYIGVDGCKSGWFFVSIGPGDECEFGVFENIESLFSAYSEAKRILIDIPIGLPFEDIKARACDVRARKVLSPKRHNSVFSPPCRNALPASSYEKACEINQRVTGRKITIMAFHLIQKIREVDALLKDNAKARILIRESHPEVCFWALAGYDPMDHYKKSEDGLAERLALLKQHFPKSGAIYKAALGRYPRKQVARDDILDALALSITASLLAENEATLPENPDKDVIGLPMEIVYAIPEKAKQEVKIQADNTVIVNKLDRLEPGKDTEYGNANCTYDQTTRTVNMLSRERLKRRKIDMKATSMPEHKVFTTDIEMRFRDIDAMGHVNNAVYFTYFEYGRIQFFDSKPQKDKFQGISFILAHVSCDYIKPLILNDNPTLFMWIKDIGNKSFVFHYQLVEKSDKSIVYATGESVQVIFDYQKNTSIPISDETRSQLTAYLKS